MLKHIEIKGFKSIKNQHLKFGRINVFIGANGAGKSNLVSFFKMIRFMISGRLQLHVGQAGGADTLLFYGSRTTPQIEGRLVFDTDAGTADYHICLTCAARDTLIFSDERLSLSKGETETFDTHFGRGHKESALTELPDQTDDIVPNVMNQWRWFQFHDTSETARIKQFGYIEDNRHLRGDAGNLAAFLHMLRETSRPHYRRIVSTIRQMIPFFDDFVLERGRLNENQIMLDWRERDSDLIFGPHQLSDGSLRLMALVTLLFHPEADMPGMILIDEPELGLHPHAVDTLASLIRYASDHSQIMVATQSAELVDYFEPHEIIVAERPEKETLFRRLEPEKLEPWLEEYTMSDLWRKNVLGGTP